jgi:hypothetical protein
MLSDIKSERQWIRTPSRGWIKYLIKLLRDNPHIDISFIKAHTNKTDWKSRGNAMADFLAKSNNKFTRDQYTTLDRDGVYLTHKNTIKGSGIKTDIKNIMQNLRRKECNKLHIQNHTLVKYHKTYRTIADSVAQEAPNHNKENIWSFFVLATLRWLFPPPKLYSNSYCCLCQNKKMADIDHLLSCPALFKYHVFLENRIHLKLLDLKIHIPWTCSALEWTLNKFLEHSEIRLLMKNRKIAKRQVSILARNYLTKKASDPIVSEFVQHVSRLFDKQDGNLNYTFWVISLDFLTIIKNKLNITVEGCADYLHQTGIIPNYISIYPEKTIIGSNFDIISTNFEGLNTFIMLPRENWIYTPEGKENFMSYLLKKISNSNSAMTPSRCVLGVFDHYDPNFLKEANDLGSKKLFTILKGSKCLHSQVYEEDIPKPNDYVKENLSFYLFQNKQMEIVDPINYNRLSISLKEWANLNSINIEFEPIMSSCQSTNTWHDYDISEASLQMSPFTFSNRLAPSLGQLKESIHNKRLITWIHNINSSDKISLVAGFIPKSLSSMIRQYNPTSYSENELDIRLIFLEEYSKMYDDYIFRINKLKQNFIKKTRGRKKTKQINLNQKKMKTPIPDSNKGNIHAIHQDRKKKWKTSIGY